MRNLIVILFLFGCNSSKQIAATTGTLDASGSYDPDGKIVKYEWRPLGNISITNTAGKISGFKGNKGLVELTVTDDKGATGKDTIFIK